MHLTSFEHVTLMLCFIVERDAHCAQRATPHMHSQVLTHGFVLDEKGSKMSKSLGNVVDPRMVITGMCVSVLCVYVCVCVCRGGACVVCVC